MPVTGRRVSAVSVDATPQVWRAVEGNADLLGAIMVELGNHSASTLSTAARVSSLWRTAAHGEAAWQRVCSALPLTAQLKAQPWCHLGWRDMFVQDRKCAAAAEAWLPDLQGDSAVAIGPRHELEHYRAMPTGETLPPGCIRATCAMLRRGDLYKRLNLVHEQTLLDKQMAIFSKLPVPAKSAEQLAGELGRTVSWYMSRKWSSPNSNWFEARVATAKHLDCGAFAGDVRDFCCSLLWFGKLGLEQVCNELTQKRDDFWTTESDKLGYEWAVQFCEDVIERKKITALAPIVQVGPPAVKENNIRKIEKSDDYKNVRLIYDDLIPRDNMPSKLAIPIFNTITSRGKYLLGIKIYSQDGDHIFASLDELNAPNPDCLQFRFINHICDCKCAEEDVRSVPNVDLFLVRKSNYSRLCLASQSMDGDVYTDDYGEGTTIHVCNRFRVEGTGFSDSTPWYFNSTFVTVEMTLNHSRRRPAACQLSAVSVSLDKSYGDDFNCAIVENFLQMVESPGFASRWVSFKGPPLPTLTTNEKMAKKKRLQSHVLPVASFVSLATNALKLLEQTQARTHAPPVMSYVMALLGAKDLMNASAVSRSWHKCAMKDSSWFAVYACEPVLSLLHSRYSRHQYSRRDFFEQQIRANALASAPLMPVDSNSYVLAVDIVANDGLMCQPRASYISELSSPGSTNRFADDREQLALLEFKPPIEISLTKTRSYPYWTSNNVSALEFFLVRKHDGKRLFLSKALQIVDYMYEEDIIFSEADDYMSCPTDSGEDAFIPTYLCTHLNLAEEPDYDAAIWNGDHHTRKICSMDIGVEGYGTGMDSALTASVAGLLQAIECPGYAHHWK